MTPAQLLISARERRDVSIRVLANAAVVSPSTIHRIERGDMEPTVEMLRKLLETLGFGLRLEGEPDYATSIASLFVSLVSGPERDALRKAAEFVGRFAASDDGTKQRMLAIEPVPTDDARWDAFAAGLAEWLSVTSDVESPSWVSDASRYLETAWWVTGKKSLRAWEYAGTPASFQEHGVYIHRESLVNV